MEENASDLRQEWEKFCQDAEKTSRANVSRTAAFLEIRQELEAAGVPVLPLKGLDLLLRCPSSSAVRPMADCDLLIRKRHIPAVMHLFESLGFRRKPDEGLTYLSPDGTQNYDILWDLWYLKDTGALWDRAETRLYENSPVLFASPEDALLYMTLYVSAHRGVLSLLLAQDLEQLLAAEPGFNWETCVQRAVSAKMKIPFLHALAYAAQNGCSRIPEKVLETLRPVSRSERRLAALYRRFVTEEGQPPVSYFFTWLGYPGIAGKLKLLRWKFLPSKWEADIHWGRSSYPVYLFKLLFRPLYLPLRAVYFSFKDLLYFRKRAS